MGDEPLRRFRLYRHVIELEDARLTLRSRWSGRLDRAAAAAVHARGVPVEEREAAREALLLRLAGDADGTPSTRPAVVPSGRRDGAPDLSAEVRWWASVSSWYGDCRLLELARASLDDPELSAADAAGGGAERVHDR